MPKIGVTCLWMAANWRLVKLIIEIEKYVVVSARPLSENSTLRHRTERAAGAFVDSRNV